RATGGRPYLANAVKPETNRESISYPCSPFVTDVADGHEAVTKVVRCRRTMPESTSCLSPTRHIHTSRYMFDCCRLLVLQVVFDGEKRAAPSLVIEDNLTYLLQLPSVHSQF